MKLNDWIVASINNPDFDAGDFQNILDMSLGNTLLLSRDEYLKSNFVRENDLFKNSKGEFSAELFDQFYYKAAENFKQFSTEDIIDNYEYSMWDVTRPKDGKVKEEKIKLWSEPNPRHDTVSIVGFNTLTRSNKSNREYAQSSPIYDTATGKFLDYSVNDISLFDNPSEYFKSIFGGDTLVYATYDEDTTEIDPFTGNTVTHKKGEWKLNDNGEYYVETLNGRSILGKEVVSNTDYLTPENSGINKYDFFDSDDVEKSVGGTVAKTVATVLPLFIPYVNSVYSGLLVAREMSKSMPMLYGMVTGLAGYEDVDSLLLNTMAAYGTKFTGSTSDYAKENIFSFENIGNLTADVATQWGQQMAIANAFSRLTKGSDKAIDIAYKKALKEYVDRVKKGLKDVVDKKISRDKLVANIGTDDIANIEAEMLKTGKWMETPFGAAAVNKFVPLAQRVVANRNKLGQDLSLAYMAIISNTDVYDTVLLKGGTPLEAAAIALGSTIGMFSVDKYLGLGETFFKLDAARKAIRESVKDNANALMTLMGIRAAETETRKGLVGLIQKGINVGRKTILNYKGNLADNTLGLFGKSLGEGLEEVSEELVTDVFKSLGELAGELGVFSLTDYGSWDNGFERYMMSLIGGSLGGGIFYGVDKFRNRNSSKETLNELTYLIRQGKKDQIIKELDRLKESGKLGSKDLSYKTTKNDKGENIFLTANRENESLNDYVYNVLKKTVNLLDVILNENQLKLSDDEVFDKMVQGEYRAVALSDFLKGNKEDAKGVSYITRYQEDFQKLANKIVEKELEILNEINSSSDEVKNTPQYNEKIEKLKSEKEELIKERDYLFGEGSLGYVEKMLFAMDTSLSGKFISLTFHQFVRYNSGKSFNELTQAEKEYYLKAFEEYSKTKKLGLDEAFKIFKDIQEKVNPAIQDLDSSDVLLDSELQKELLELDPFSKFLNYDSRLEGESDEDYNKRKTKQENETDELFKSRILERLKKIDNYNKENLYKWIKDIAARLVDKTTFRKLQAKIGLLKKNAFNNVIGRNLKDYYNNPELLNRVLNTIRTVSDRQELYNQIKSILFESIYKDIRNGLENRLGETIWGNIKLDFDSLGISYNNVLTKLDLYNYFKAIQNSKNLTVEETVNQIAKTFNNQELIDGVSYTDISADVTDFFIRKENGLVPDVSDENNEIVEVSDESIKLLADEETENRFELIKENLEEDVFPELDSDEQLNALNKLEANSYTNNVVIPILKKITLDVRGSNINIEEFLEDIYKQYNSGTTARDFELTDDQIKTLQLFKLDLEMVKAFVYAASVKSGYDTPVGHNKSINEFVDNHKKVFGNFKYLPEISEDKANYVITEADKYSKEIDAWITRSNNNTADKTKQFINADIAFTKARLEFYEKNRSKFKINPTLDLLDGYEEISQDDPLLKLIEIEELLHNNFKNAKVIELEDILDVLIPGITNLEELKAQKTSKLDDTITYKDLTSYDKFTLVISNFALSDYDFFTELKQFITNNDDLAPLSIQEYCSRIDKAQEQNPELINRSLHWLKNKLGLYTDVLENTTIINGVPGAGKTKAVARLSVGEGENTWLCGPTEDLTNTLLKTLPKGTVKNKSDLFSIILGSLANDFITISRSDNKVTNYYSPVSGLDSGNHTIVLNDSVKVNKILNPPKYIVIDEATHFNTAELLVLSKFAKENNISLKLLGDDGQNGVTNPGVMENLSREYVLAWRTPKLFISLRGDNIQKIYNLKQCTNILDKLLNTNTKEELEYVVKDLLENDFKNLTFRYYNKELLSGEIIKKLLPIDIIKKLKGKIAFIGDELSEEYIKLKELADSIDGIEEIKVINPLNVQGGEYDYIIIDKKWNINLEGDLVDKGVNIRDFIKDLRTMISRSIKGTIIIDRDNISDIVSNVEDDFSGVSLSIQNAIEPFRRLRLQQINKILLNRPEPNPESEPNPNPNPEPNPNNEEIEGTDVKESEIEEEKEPMKDNSKERNNETQLVKNEERTLTTPARAYSNIIYSGINIKRDDWLNEDNSRRDLGIFLREGQVVSDGKEKDKLVRRLIELNCLFNYGIDEYYDRIDADTRNLIRKEDLKNAQFFISVEEDSDYNSLIGLTDINEKVPLNGKIVVVTAKFKDIKGNDCEITLGSLANPETWANNESAIRESIQKRIDNGAKNTEELEAYLKDLSSNISAYRNRINEITSSDWTGRTIGEDIINGERVVHEISRYEKKDNGDEWFEISSNDGVESQFTIPSELILEEGFEKNTRIAIETVIIGKDGDIQAFTTDSNLVRLRRVPFNFKYRINTPLFTGFTTLIKTNNLRLENMNNNRRPYDSVSHYTVKSDVHAFMENIPNLQGKSVMYVTGNILLNETELAEMYENLKKGISRIPQVRAVILDSMGVSFSSLYDPEYKDLYVSKDGKVIYTTPFKLAPMGVRMYIAMWNFRSNLKKFLKAYNDWRDKIELSDNEIEELCKLDNEQYNSIKGEEEYLSEEEYRNKVPKEIADKLKPIWDFNDNLHDSVRQFRLGYNSKNGAYIRKLTNLKDGGFYKDINNTLGIYINPSMAMQFDRMLDTLFNNVINKILPSDKNPLTYIDKKSLKEGWFKDLEATKKLSASMYTINEEGDETFERGEVADFTKQDALALLPVALIKTAKFLSIRGINPDSFDEYLAESSDQRYVIKIEDEVLDWKSIADELDDGQVEVNKEDEFVEGRYLPGIRYYKKEGEKKIGHIDKRIDNMFSLMFHGLISTKNKNDFEKGDIRATDAAFKFGFFANAIKQKNKGEPRYSLPAVNGSKKFYSADVVASRPIMGISLEEYVPETTTVKKVEEESNDSLNDVKLKIIPLLREHEIKCSEKDLNKCKNIEDILSLVNKEINKKFTNYFSSKDTEYPFIKLLSKIEYKNGEFIPIYVIQTIKELEGETIKETTWDKEALKVITSNGKEFNIQNPEGMKIVCNEISSAEPVVRTIGTVKQLINEKLDQIIDDLTDSEKLSLLQFVKNTFKGISDSEQPSDELVAKKLNSILEFLNENFADDDEPDESYEDNGKPKWSEKLNKVIKDLSDLKTTSCNRKI